MSVETALPVALPVALTERAAKRIAEILREEPGPAMLRVAVTGGGCSGFQYDFCLDDARTEDDLVIARDGATVLIDPVSLDFLKGAEIDFVDEMIGASFKVKESQRDVLLRLRDQFLRLALPCEDRKPESAGSNCAGSNNTRGKGLFKIATWNVNSVKARIDGVRAWLQEAAPDIACFQEIKTTDDSFPTDAFESLGYNCAVHGQKSYNGVAILSKRPPEDVVRGLPGGEGDDHARYIEAVVPTAAGGVVRVASIYAPNGNPAGTERFTYKLAWLERLRRHIQYLLSLEEPLILAGDYNVIPTPDDCYDPAAWVNDALFQPESRAAFRRILNQGLSDGFRLCHAEPHRYTFWDYQAGSWVKDHGIRIDHILLSPQAADRIESCAIERKVRGWEKPSDHVPVLCTLAI